MTDTLSPAGEARRAEILRELQEVMGRRRAVRMGVRIGSAAMLFAVASAAVLLSQGSASRAPSPRPFEAAPELMAMFVATDEGIMERLSAPSDGSRIQLISDSDLWEWLADTGHDQGWVRVGGRVILAQDMARPGDDTDSPGDAS